MAVLFALACQPRPPRRTVESELVGQSAKLDNLNARLGRLEKAFDSLKSSMDEIEKSSRQGRADQSVVMEDLRTELKTTAGALDILKHEAEQTSQGNQKVREEFDARLNELDQRFTNFLKAAEGATSSGNSKGTPSGGGAETQYKLALHYYDNGDYAKAITEFQNLIDNHPQSPKVCDALLGQGLAFSAMKDTGKAKLFLGEVVRRCPKSPSATKANERLSKLAPSKSKK